MRVALELALHFRRNVRQRFFIGRYRCNRGIMSPINHAPVRGVPCWADLRLRATMNMHYSDSLNGFWVGRNVVRPGPMALASPRSSFGQVGWVRRPYHKVGAQGPNGSGGSMSYISPPLIRARSSGTNQGIQEAKTIQEAQQVDTGWLRNPLMRPQKVRCD